MMPLTSVYLTMAEKSPLGVCPTETLDGGASVGGADRACGDDQRGDRVAPESDDAVGQETP